VRYQVIVAASMKMAVFWDVAPCRLVLDSSTIRVIIALIMEAAGTTETSVNFYQTTLRNNLEGVHFQRNVVFVQLTKLNY
jgi:hypothetical protein